jgi:hypothetical protein
VPAPPPPHSRRRTIALPLPAVAGTVTDGPRWRDLEMEAEGILQPISDVALLTYRASAVRGGEERYRALVSSAYVKRDGAWKLAFHQQTPLAG